MLILLNDAVIWYQGIMIHLIQCAKYFVMKGIIHVTSYGDNNFKMYWPVLGQLEIELSDKIIFY